MQTRRGQSGKNLPCCPQIPRKSPSGAGNAGGHNFVTAKAATTPTNDHQVTFQDPHTIPEDTLEHLDSYLTKISNAVANEATEGSLDASDISSMSKSLDTLTLFNTPNR